MRAGRTRSDLLHIRDYMIDVLCPVGDEWLASLVHHFDHLLCIDIVYELAFLTIRDRL